MTNPSESQTASSPIVPADVDPDLTPIPTGDTPMPSAASPAPPSSSRRNWRKERDINNGNKLRDGLDFSE